MALRQSDRRREALPGITGVVRLDRRVNRLLNRLHAGDIAVIDVADLDRSTADALVAAGVSAVVNAQPSISGRYPNLGPEVLVGHGIALLDEVGTEIFAEVKEGSRLRLDGEVLYIGDRVAARGNRQDAESIRAAMRAAKAGLSAQLQAFAASTQQHMEREKELLLDGVGLPELTTRFRGRHVLLVAKGYDYRSDLRSLKHYIREFRPVLVGVDGGADVLRDAGYQADLVIGNLDEMSDAALRDAGEVVAHADRHGRVEGLARVQDLRIEPVVFATAGTSEDAAMLLADAGSARLIVTVGMRATLEEFLDAGRGGIASTVLTRLKIGGRLVDAKAAGQLYQTRVSAVSLVLLAVAAALAIAVVLIAGSSGDSYAHLLADGWDHL
ncbi:putative cytokinetic ring protein SteA, partial [Jatrophihabitans sp.]|uniref:putative cytokinetic ring protein SteA n=1 Tax=Jatrophihabitans sp. TaxID=1932789 RepID=UPI0038CD7A78